jgi:hypothetical protein
MKKIITIFTLILMLTTSIPTFMTEANLNSTPLTKSNSEYIVNDIENEALVLISKYLELQKNALLTRHVNINTFEDILINDNLREYENELLEFIIISQNQDDTKISSYNYIIKNIKLSAQDSLIRVNVSIEKTIQYSFLSEPSQINDEYIFIFNYKNETLGIEGITTTEEIRSLYGPDTNFALLKKNAKSNYTKYKDQLLTDAQENKIALETFSIASNFVNYSTTNRQNAATYSTTYTNNSGVYDSDDYNYFEFKVYGKDDCQNFISQCIWYGFGGRNSANLDFPMNGVWWANLSGETTTWNWTSASAFKSYITGNYSGNLYGVHGIEYISPSNMLTGDYVYVPGHVMFINNVSGTSAWENIYISAHTRNRLNVNLKALYSGISVPPSDMRFMKIYGCLQP